MLANVRNDSKAAMPTSLEILRDHYQHRDQAARAWKQAGGQVIGYICETVPEELIRAAGFFAYRVSGSPDIGTEALHKYVHPLAAKAFSIGRTSQLEYVNSICSMALEGRYDFLDYLVISNTRRVILLIQAQLLAAQTAYPQLRMPERYVLDRAQTPFLASSMFNRDRVKAFRTQLQTWAGRKIDDASLQAAIAEGNEMRAIRRQAASLRHSAHLSGVEALWIYGASRIMPPRDFIELARSALRDAEQRTPRSGARLFAGGSPIDQSQLYEVLESVGATVVADDHAWGDRSAEADIVAGTDPLEALITHYETLAPLVYPLSHSVSRTVSLAQAAGVHGAVFNLYRGDDIKLWEAPDEIAALTQAGIPSLHLQEQPYRISDTSTLEAQVSDFVGSLDGQRA
jgi:benzoyl-CoA reductase/2-hydroxyglutaryl-CoA dehydratase subunit BcrC/BadD/HgdB